jgi:hypothetical protein
MAKQCRHLRHEVQPQQNIWRGAEFKKVQPAMVFCSDCGDWLYDKLINWDLVPKNALERREKRLDDSRPGRPVTPPTHHDDAARRANAV